MNKNEEIKILRDERDMLRQDFDELMLDAELLVLERDQYYELSKRLMRTLNVALDTKNEYTKKV